MKKILVILAVIAAAAVAIAAVSAENRLDTQFEANLEALAQTEGGSIAGCYGPKRANLYGQVFCKCRNTVPCQDEHGCN